MNKTNYIKHINGVFLQFYKDNRLNPTHISMYLALFNIWNYNRFPDIFYINREEVMKYSKIGSKSTYHRCIKELSYWKYILYIPSHNPFKGSQIKMFNFETSSNQEQDLQPIKNGQAQVSNTNINKQETTNLKRGAPKNEKEVIQFFFQKDWPKFEAHKFFNHYQATGWKMGGRSPILNWQAAATKWMLKAEEIKISRRFSPNKQTENPVDQNQDNLKINKDKNYHEPL